MLDYDRIRQPVVLLRVNGEDADDLSYQLIQVTINEGNRNLIEAQLEFVIADPSADFVNTMLDDPRCQPDASWSIQWGYFDDLAQDTFRVSHFAPEFGSDGAAKLTLYLTSRGSVATRDTGSFSWGNVQTSEIALQIAERYGLYADVEDSNDRRTRDRAYVQPATVTDLQYLIDLASRINFVCYVENDVLHYHRPDTDSAPIMELFWYSGENNAIVLDFKPTIKETRARRTRVAGGDSSASSEDGGRDTAHGGFDINLTSLTATRFSGRHNQDEVAVTTPTAEEDAANRRRHAEARQRSLLERANEATMTTIGQPTLRKDRNILVGGTSLQLNGVWHIHESTHTLNANGQYLTEITLRRGAADVNVTGGESIDARPNAATEATAAEGAPNVIAVNLGGRSTYERPPRHDTVEQPITVPVEE